MQSVAKVDQARRLCTALHELLDASEDVETHDSSLIARTQVIVTHLATLAEDSTVKRMLRDTIQTILNRWQEQIQRRAVRLREFRGELNRLEQSRMRLAHLSLSYRSQNQGTRLQATA